MFNAALSLIGGAGFRPQRAATNFPADPATPPRRLGELLTGRDGRRLRGHRFFGVVRTHMKRACCRTLAPWRDGCGALRPKTRLAGPRR